MWLPGESLPPKHECPGAPARPADHEFRGHGRGKPARRASLDEVDQPLGGEPSHRVLRDPHGRERRIRVRAHLDVVHPDHGQPFRHANAAFAGGPERADGHGVGHREQRRRRLRQGEEAPRRRRRRLDADLGPPDERRILRDRPRGQRLAIPLEGLPAEGVAHGRAEKRDAAMAEAEEMLGREPGAGLVVGDHGRQVHAGQVVVHEDDRKPAVSERQEQSGVDGAEDERPVHRAMTQDAAEVSVRGRVGRRREHEAVSAGLGHLRHPAQHDPVERVVEHGGHVAALQDGDALGAPAGQAASVEVRDIPELGGGLGDSLARPHVDPAPAVEGLGHGGRRDAGESGDVPDRHHGAMPNRFVPHLDPVMKGA